MQERMNHHGNRTKGGALTSNGGELVQYLEKAMCPRVATYGSSPCQTCLHLLLSCQALPLAWHRVCGETRPGLSWSGYMSTGF